MVMHLFLPHKQFLSARNSSAPAEQRASPQNNCCLIYKQKRWQAHLCHEYALPCWQAVTHSHAVTETYIQRVLAEQWGGGRHAGFTRYFWVQRSEVFASTGFKTSALTDRRPNKVQQWNHNGFLFFLLNLKQELTGLL